MGRIPTPAGSTARSWRGSADAIMEGVDVRVGTRPKHARQGARRSEAGVAEALSEVLTHPVRKKALRRGSLAKPNSLKRKLACFWRVACGAAGSRGWDARGAGSREQGAGNTSREKHDCILYLQPRDPEAGTPSCRRTAISRLGGGLMRCACAMRQRTAGRQASGRQAGRRLHACMNGTASSIQRARNRRIWTCPSVRGWLRNVGGARRVRAVVRAGAESEAEAGGCGRAGRMVTATAIDQDQGCAVTVQRSSTAAPLVPASSACPLTGRDIGKKETTG
ncbi:hypothetical protein EVG20_g8594 [Dentipellis fragilis]|uniref:Uncharacterized protein n=1 Tax=Dentipellis fragilis TaxID=205917 RepID=A0A4Y9Y5D5_9AGAM|nr:hypothetical protein EVG20_g8594 [Dentipellis fragilis]